MGSLLTREEVILEFASSNISNDSIVEEEKILYTIHPLKNTWIYPWKHKKVQLNIVKAYLPDNYCGIIAPYTDKLDIPSKIIVPVEGDGLTHVYVRAMGFLPRRLKTDMPIVTMLVLRGTQCQMLCLDENEDIEE